VCEGFLGIPVNWDLWVDLFRAELHTFTTSEPKVRRAMRAGGVTIVLRETRREIYIPCTMTSNNAEWEREWFYLRNDEPGLPPWTGKVVREKADSWWHGVSPSSRQDRLDSALNALKALADVGLTAASVPGTSTTGGSFLSWRGGSASSRCTKRPTPWRWRNRGCCDLLPQEYAATRERCAVNLKVIRNDDVALWSFVVLPYSPLVSGFPPLFGLLIRGVLS
jgi:hypothetical protein